MAFGRVFGKVYFDSQLNTIEQHSLNKVSVVLYTGSVKVLYPGSVKENIKPQGEMFSEIRHPPRGVSKKIDTPPRWGV